MIRRSVARSRSAASSVWPTPCRISAPLVGIAIATLACGVAGAQVFPPIEENVVVTATLSPQEETQIGAATTVLNRARIEDSGAQTVQELLRSVPGVDIVRSGEDGSVTSLFLRGANSTHALVLVNGVRVNSPYFSGYDFSALTTENVERIEIVRGPFSSLYGSDASGGVVQIFTRPASAHPDVGAAIEVGGRDSKTGTVFASTGSGPVSLTASYRGTETDGERANSDWREDNGSVRLDAAVGEVIRFGVEGSILDGEAGVPGPVDGESPNARRTFREERVATPVSFRPADGHDATILLAHVRSTPTYSNPDPPFPSQSDTDARTLQARATDHWTMARHGFTAFASWERGSVTAKESEIVLFDERQMETWGAGVQDAFPIGARGFATVGLRADRHDAFGTALSPRASVSWLMRNGRSKLRGSAGSAFRAPSLGELFYPRSGNPDLRPERSRSIEVGIERYFGDSDRVEMSVFRSDYQDMIFYDFLGSRQNENVRAARTRGVEVAIRRRVGESLALDAGYTYLDASDETTGEPLLRRPRHRAYATATFRPLPRLLATARATFVGSRPDVDGITYQRVTNPSYTRLDVYARYDLGTIAPYLRLDNATDQRYEEADGFPAAGVRLSAGFEVRWPGRRVHERS